MLYTCLPPGSNLRQPTVFNDNYSFVEMHEDAPAGQRQVLFHSKKLVAL